MVYTVEGFLNRDSSIRLRISRRGFNKLFKSHRVKKAISNGTLRILEKYSQKVDKDALTEFLTERRYLL